MKVYGSTILLLDCVVCVARYGSIGVWFFRAECDFWMLEAVIKEGVDKQEKAAYKGSRSQLLPTTDGTSSSTKSGWDNNVVD